MSCQQDLPAPLTAQLRSEANAVALDSKRQGDEYGSKALESSGSKDKIQLATWNLQQRLPLMRCPASLK